MGVYGSWNDGSFVRELDRAFDVLSSGGVDRGSVDHDVHLCRGDGTHLHPSQARLVGLVLGALRDHWRDRV